jgi:hypothetical protein
MNLAVPLIWIALAQGPVTMVPLSGTVVGPDGRAVVGADVILAGMPVYDPPIVARSRSDGEGRFTLDRPANLKGESRFIAPILWVVKPGFRLSLIKFPGPMPMPGAGEPVRVVLQAAGKAEVRVERPDGTPLAGAGVRVEWFGRQWTMVPEAVEHLIEVTTDKDGRAVIDAATNDEVAYVDVHSKEFGIQGRPFYPTTTHPKRVWLRPVTSLKGRLKADDPTMVKGWRVTAYTRSGDPQSREPDTTGYDTGTTGDDGRFAFPVIAPGGLQLVLKPPGDLPVLADLPQSLAVVEGKENTLEIPLRPAVTITGRVLESGTDTPVPGVKLWFCPSGPGKSEYPKTDASGRYTFQTVAGKGQVIVTEAPPSHASTGGTDRKEFDIPGGPGRLELVPIEVIRAAPPLRFIVRDESGKPVVGATVRGQSPSGIIMEDADDRGEFRVGGVPPGGEFTIEVHHHDRTTDGPLTAVASAPGPVIVTIVPGLAVAAAGRVLGPGGTPIPGALVRMQFRKENKQRPGRFDFPENVQFDNEVEVHTGADGTFRTPKELYRKAREFRAEVFADGFLRNETGWVAPVAGDLVRLPDMTLRRLRTLRFVSGRVVDREGQGVAGAAVFQSGDASRPTATTADAGGRFRLPGVPDAEAFVFAEKAGFRFGGAVVGQARAAIEIRLARVDEPPPSIPKPLPALLTRDEERALGRELIAPLVIAARLNSPAFQSMPVIPALARVDPGRVLEMLENRVLSSPANVLNHVALAQLEDDPAAAVATIEADLNPAARAEGFLVLADAWPDSDRAHRIELIDRALAEARRVDDKDVRLSILGHVADRWLELDLPDRAKEVLHEGRRIVASLPRNQYFSGMEEFADSLAAFDLATARLIFERKGRTNVSPTDPATLNRHLGEAAVRLAAIDPAQAERLVPAVTPNFWNDARADYVLRICQRMARADVPRARKILDTIDDAKAPGSYVGPALRPEGLARMASERAATDLAGATRLLDEAFAEFRQIAHEGGNYDVSWRMAEILPLVESIEPDRLEERLWLTIACRAPLITLPDSREIEPRMNLALLVSRYDRAMAAIIIAPALERLPELFADTTGFNVPNASVIKPLAAYDPRAAAALIGALPESARKAPGRNDNWQSPSLDAQLRLAAAQMLGLPVDERMRKAIRGDYQTHPYRRVTTPLNKSQRKESR